ncbi:ABC transporter permease [Hansschlegelia sp. KR7-227]|uniref:ABC transporter permease n=1 Tax=Hansschlegelia sp. KR7-227 TaxID=3400914 RepID=UPI003C037AC0
MDLVLNILLGVVVAATPLAFAAIGELVTEKSGVLNLGVEGMMIVGAVAAFAGTYGSGSYVVGILAGALAGATMAALFGLLTLTLMSNQVATGLALTLFGLGLSALIGQAYSGVSLPQFPRLDIPVLTDIPFVGPLIFGQDALVYLSLALVAGVAWFLTKTRGGLILRAVGENHEAAHGIGYPVIAIRYLATMFGGACAGLGGAYLSLVQTPLWVEKMTAGRGWIALALVVFASWRPLRVLGGAYLFGGIAILQLHSQALGLKIDAQILSMLPYLATIIVLVVISRDRVKMKLNAPSCLGKAFYATS